MSRVKPNIFLLSFSVTAAVSDALWHCHYSVIECPAFHHFDIWQKKLAEISPSFDTANGAARIMRSAPPRIPHEFSLGFSQQTLHYFFGQVTVFFSAAVEMQPVMDFAVRVIHSKDVNGLAKRALELFPEPQFHFMYRLHSVLCLNYRAPDHAVFERFHLGEVFSHKLFWKSQRCCAPSVAYAIFCFYQRVLTVAFLCRLKRKHWD